MQNGPVFAESRNGVDCRHDVDQHRLSREDALHRFAVGRFDGLVASQLREHSRHLRVATGGRSPVDMGDMYAGARQAAGEPLKANVHDAER